MPDPYETICHQSEEKWLPEKKKGIGASEIAAVLGINRWKSAIQLYAEKIGEVEPPDLSKNEFVEWGKRLEPAIIQGYKKRSGRPAIHFGLLIRSKEHPWALATPDGITGENGEISVMGDSKWPLEVKNTSAFKAEDWEEGCPEYYLYQLQHQMLVTGKPKATIACLLGGNKLVWTDVYRDETLIKKIIYQGSKFWQMVQDRIPPAPDGSDSAKRALADLFPKDTGEIIELPPDLMDIANDLDAAKADAKMIKSVITEKENLIRAAMKDATQGVFLDGSGFTLKHQERAEHIVKKSSFRMLRRIKSKGE